MHYTAKDYPDAGRQAIDGGLDVIFQTAYDHHKLFIPPFLDGSIDTNKINEAVKRILRAKFELGLFENPYVLEKDLQSKSDEAAYKSLAKKSSHRIDCLVEK